MSARSREHQRLASSSLCSRRDPIILEGLFELVLNIVRIVGELHEHGVVARAAATSQARIILLRIVGELHEHGVVAGAAATGEARIILPRVVGELLIVATGEARIILARSDRVTRREFITTAISAARPPSNFLSNSPPTSIPTNSACPRLLALADKVVE